MADGPDAGGFTFTTPRAKQALYDAVLARAVARHAPTPKLTMTPQPRTPSSRTSARSSTFSATIGTSSASIQREALADGSRVAEFFGRPVDDAVTALTPVAKRAGLEPQRLVLDLLALCWYPFAHEHTLMRALGMNARDPAFLDEQKRHLGELVRAMTRPGRERRSRRQRSASHS